MYRQILRRLASLLGVVFVASTAGVALTATPAAAAEVYVICSNYSYVVHGSMWCLDDSSCEPGEINRVTCGLRMVPRNNSEHQRWRLRGTGHPWGTWSSLTGWALDDSREAGLRMHPYNGGAWQQWEQFNAINGWQQTHNKATGLCLDDSEHGLRTWPCTYSGPNVYQHFYFFAVG